MTSNWPLIIGALGLGGAGGYYYLQSKPSIGTQVIEKTKELGGSVDDRFKSLTAEKQAGNQNPGVMGALMKDTWTPFTLTNIEPHSRNTKIYHFSFPDDAKDKAAGGEVASALLVKSPEGDEEVKDDKGKPVIRPYTPISSPDETGSLTLMIKRYQDGKLTPFIASMQPGSQLLFKGPITKYQYQSNAFDRGLCIAGGAGITPMYQLISHSLRMKEDKTKWTLVFSNVSEDDILLRKDWDNLAQANPERLDVKYVIDKASKGWNGETGFITAPMISKFFPRKEGDNEKVMAFVCGPPPQVKSIAGPKDGPRQGELLGALKELGYVSEEVFKF